MKICFMCDIHLGERTDTIQYEAFEWALGDITKKGIDCIVFAGDVTSDGNIDTYKNFINKMKGVGIPFLFIPGNSDLRNSDYSDDIKGLSSKCENVFGDTVIYAVNDCDGNICDLDFSCLEKADGNSIVFMHHPSFCLKEASRKRFDMWRSCHKDTHVFYGHCHKSDRNGNDVSLQCLDPDKAIGESPLITYYDTETQELKKAYFFSPVPTDIYSYFGISCYDALKDIKFAVDNKLKNIELRPGVLDVDKVLLASLIEEWRNVGGENLSLHLPDVEYKDGAVLVESQLDLYIELANFLRIDRITQHVPKVSVRCARENENALDKVCEYLGSKFNNLNPKVVIGVENMHMTALDEAGDNRRFGYLPSECLEFMNLLSSKCKNKVGINFDIGHARNNAPYNDTYPIGTWFSAVGKYIVGYHIHQVKVENGIFKNHRSFDNVYGRLISLASTFRCWSEGKINKAPFVFEMSEENAYKKTLETFDKHRQRSVFDIHAHTRYSWCGKDEPKDVIETAIRNGMSVIGISDHNYGIAERKAQYLEEIRNLAEEYKDRISVLVGIEIATPPDKYDLVSPDEIKDYDYCLLESVANRQSLAYPDLIGFANSLKIPCGIAHTDMFAYCKDNGLDTEEFFEKLAENGVFWELNVSYDSIHGYNEHKYVYDFMKDKEKIELVKRTGLCVSVGFDGHRIEDYDGSRVFEAYDFLKKHNVKTADELIFSRK